MFCVTFLSPISVDISVYKDGSAAWVAQIATSLSFLPSF